MGRAPKAVRVMRDGKVRLAARDEEHRGIIEAEIAKVEGVEVENKGFRTNGIDLRGVRGN